ncbi:MAG: DUF3179 domain-containing protein [Gemmatimonadaceae bacterium]|nr:DUF3179 domain-containing protein [Chitinophagaceae bacterium]
MKKIFYTGLIGLLLFEICNVYFIMPMPGSQKMQSIDLAYFLYRWRWIFRVLFGAMIVIGFLRANWKRRWVPALPLILVLIVIYYANFKMAADHMFLQPAFVQMDAAQNAAIEKDQLVLGVFVKNESKAYPIQYIGYHHQVVDSVGGEPVLVTYCTVCRTGRVYSPIVNGRKENFRLVGMDHFNAMIEDQSTGSWWRQSTGEAIAGKMKGSKLKEIQSYQASLAQWVSMHPNTLVMRPDTLFKAKYDSMRIYEKGGKGSLTKTDPDSWNDKSLVIGIELGETSKAYDWNEVKKQRVLNEMLNGKPVTLLMAADEKSFFAFERPDNSPVVLSGDTIGFKGRQYSINGTGLDTVASLKRLQAYQEFWHSWKTFHPTTLK